MRPATTSASHRHAADGPSRSHPLRARRPAALAGLSAACSWIRDLAVPPERGGGPGGSWRWRARRDSNPRPSGPQPDALSTELRAQRHKRIPRQPVGPARPTSYEVARLKARDATHTATTAMTTVMVDPTTMAGSLHWPLKAARTASTA